MRALLVTAAIAGATASLPVNAQVSTAPAVSQSEHNRRIVTAAFDRWMAGGDRFFAEMLSPDVVWTVEGSGPNAGTYHGLRAFIEAIRPFVSRLRAPVRPVERRIWADGDHVIICWSGEALAADGQVYRNRYAWIFRMADRKAVQVDAFLDLAPYDDVIRRIPGR